jgi:hypothetical protein
MEMSGKFHDPSTLTLMKELPVPFEWGVGWVADAVVNRRNISVLYPVTAVDNIRGY